ncbi:hypothetical protein OG389_20680 [Streptomyces sp. NBC_00435]|uniref:hypothetical protein n=1 Tax=Streptomyces sp. NBC_00435 TaxID=2903649 RepID=UPI002E1CB004
MALQGSLRVPAVWAVATSLVIGGAAIWLVTAPGDRGTPGEDPGNGAEVSCAEAMEFARASLPAGARHGKCERADRPDTTMTGSFRMDRDGVGAWLSAAFPGALEHELDERPGVCPKPGPGYDPEGGNRCLGVAHPDPVRGRARQVEISIEQQVDDVRVRFVASGV